MLRYWRASRPALITLGCVSFVGGIGLAAMWRVASLWLLAVALVSIAGCWRRLGAIAIPAAIVAGLLCGLWRGSVIGDQLAGYTTFMNKKTVVQGTVVEDPTYGSDSQQDMLVGAVVINGQSLPGHIRIKTMSPVEPMRGDRVQAIGKLYGGFGNYQASLYYADLSLVHTANDPITALRRVFAAHVYSLLSDTQASLGLGFVVGIKSALPQSLTDQLKLLGLTHIVVASGYNLTILVRLARRIFARQSHYQATTAALAMIIGFVLVTGFSPSMNRAALVSGLSILAYYYGRRMHPALIISLSAAITAAFAPLYVWSDIGWWLSFLSFAGVMLLAPLLQRRIFNKRQPKLIGQVVLETVSAQLVTLPLMMLVFGQASPLSLLANVLVVPLIPLAMIVTFITGAVGWLIPFVAWPAQWLLGYMCELIQVMASWSTAWHVTISPLVMLGLYACVLILGLCMWRKTKHDYLATSVIE